MRFEVETLIADGIRKGLLYDPLRACELSRWSRMVFYGICLFLWNFQIF